MKFILSLSLLNLVVTAFNLATKISEFKRSEQKCLHKNNGAPFSNEFVLIKIQRIRRKKFLRRRFFYPTGNEASYNPTVITNQEAHMVNGNMENSKTTTGSKTDIAKTKRKVTITNYFNKISSTGKY